ncbi:unnamed protein product [Haemonchus placei]|uniref:Tyr recombinase domain-containing protein n=1 Tax=Haemonchus placei TaxID=6290 RepID=A0A0N4WIH6_HAEPC|nr:unnamed protein product [Haemonchus placei]
MCSDVKLELQQIPFMTKAGDYSVHCAEKAEFLQNLLRHRIISSVTLHDRFHLMSRGYLPIVSGLKAIHLERKPVTIISNSTLITTKKERHEVRLLLG